MPTFQSGAYTLVGHDPGVGGTTTVATVLVPVTLAFEAKKTMMDAAADVPHVLRSPVFAKFAFPTGGTTQYGDALLRTHFPKAEAWHTLLGKPEVMPLKIAVPVGYGYILTSKSSGRSFAVADLEFLQKAIFQKIPKQEGKLVIVVTHNTAYYALGDATVCCSWGTHGVDSATGTSFALASYINAAPAVVTDEDVQPVTQQLGEFLLDPLHDPLVYGGRNTKAPGNAFSAWLRSRPGELTSCGGTGVGSTYFLLQPTNTNPKNNFPASKAFAARVDGVTYHVQNAATLAWYTGNTEGYGRVYSFPDAGALKERSQPCPSRGGRGAEAPTNPTVAAAPATSAPNGHKLIGYWAGYGGPGSTFPMNERISRIAHVIGRYDPNCPP